MSFLNIIAANTVISEKKNPVPNPHIIIRNTTCRWVSGTAASGLILKLPIAINPKKTHANRLIKISKV
jgi:hypothetical protein